MTTPARPLAPLITLTEEEFDPPPFKQSPYTDHLPSDPVMRAAWYANLAYALKVEVEAQRAAHAEKAEALKDAINIGQRAAQEAADLRARLAEVEQDQQQTRLVLDPLSAVRSDVSNADLARNLWGLTEDSHERASKAERDLAEARDRLARLEQANAELAEAMADERGQR